MKTKDVRKMIRREMKDLLGKKAIIKIKSFDSGSVEVSLYYGKEHIQTIVYEV